MNILFLTLLCCTIGFAHDLSDWRYDYEAYLSIQKELTLIKSTKSIGPRRIDMDYFRKKLSIFAAIERKSTERLDQARVFLAREYQNLGFEVSLHPFGSGTNFIAEKKGKINPEKILILSSHIDTVGNKGANDNGTGTIGALAIAKALAHKDFAYTLRILGFDREEKGLKGSDAYVAILQDKKNIIGDINIEMMGHHSKNDGAFHLIDCSKSLIFNRAKPESEFLSAEVKKSIEGLGLNLHVVKACTDRSDHASFWRHGIPAIVISENFFGGDGDPCYHARCDIVDERLNYPYMANILEATLDSTQKLLSVKDI